MSEKTSSDRLAHWLREAYAEAGQCPPPQAFHRAAIGELGPAERARLEAHAAGCPACAAERRLAELFAAPADAAAPLGVEIDRIVSRLDEGGPRRDPAGPAPDAEGRVVRFPGVGRWMSAPALRWLAAAALILAAGAVLYTLRSVSPSLPARVPADVLRGARIEVISPVGELAALPEAWRWNESEHALSYRLTVIGVGGEVLWQAKVAGSPAPLAQDLKQQLLPRVLYRWRVEALDAQGDRIGWSEDVSFRVVAPPRE